MSESELRHELKRVGVASLFSGILVGAAGALIYCGLYHWIAWIFT